MKDRKTNRPYGAWEMKSSYQVNMLKGMGLTFALVCLAVLWLTMPPAEDIVGPCGDEPEDSIRIVSILDKGFVIVPDSPPVGGPGRSSDASVFSGNVIPRPDIDFIDAPENEFISTDEHAEDVMPGGTSDGPTGEQFNASYGGAGYGDELPDIDTFFVVEALPEAVHKARPVYPRLLETEGIEGSLWVKALVDRAGNVVDARVHKESGFDSFDRAAIEAALKNKYKPAIQNGRPVAVWIAYEVRFEL